jgi:hypothetical protein
MGIRIRVGNDASAAEENMDKISSDMERLEAA